MQPTHLTDGVTRVLSTNTYGPSNGELERVTYGNGQSVAYSYDQLGRVRSQGNNGEYEWYYTNSGQLTDSYDYVNAVHTRYAYDTTGRLIRASTNQNQSAQYSYDVSNNVTKVLYRTFGQNRKTEYGYGLEERLESAQLPGGKTVTYGYDGFNRMIQRKLGN